jgi:hypothetical protein
MSMLIKLFIVLLSGLFFMHDATAKDFCLGTFHNLHFNSEGGDLSGMEIKIVGTNSGKQAAIQFSDGEPGSLVVTPVICKNAHIAFTIPKDHGRTAATFDGVISKNRMAGELVFEGGGRDKVVLLRRKSYWD